MSDQDNEQVSTLQRPTTDDPMAWKAYWKAHGWLWRTEPEIDTERQKYLGERRSITPNIEKGIYSFKDIKLSRADVEWLLVTHENGRGPIDWSDESQRERIGLDLRGADLHGSEEQRLYLASLPLARLIGGLPFDERLLATEEQKKLAGTIFTEVDLSRAKLDGAILNGAQLEGTHLDEAQLKGAHLYRARLKNVRLNKAQLGGADLRGVGLEDAVLNNVMLGDDNHIGPCLADVQWGTSNLAVVDWSQIAFLGDEQEARQKLDSLGKRKGKDQRLKSYKKAVRANRQLSVVLQGQGLNEDAAHFAYRAQLCQRFALRLQKNFSQYFFSLLLDLLAGYGYRPGRSVIWYLVMIFGFALAYFAIGHLPFFPDAFVFSLTSFHGRGFFPGLGNEASLHNPLVVTAAFEAVVGLLIEISFIATFTQRFFGR